VASFTEFETVFFMLNHAVLIGDINKAKMFLEILREDCENKPELFDQLDEYYRNRLVHLGNIVENNVPTTRANDIEESKNYYNVKKRSEDYVQKEKDVVKMIYHSGQLESFFPGLKITDYESPTEFGKVDLVAFDEVTAYPIEVKLNSGRHSIVSQIEKYMRHFWKLLNLKMWKTVVGIVIAQKFEKFALEEFKRLNVIPFSYSIRKSKLKLTRL